MARYIVSDKRVPRLNKRKVIVKSTNTKLSIQNKLSARPHKVVGVIKQRPQAKPQSPQSVKRQNKIRSVVNHHRHVKVARSKKGPQVKYISKDISPESLQKIRNIHNYGLGRILVIVANGPSILDVDLVPLRNHANIDILSVNKPDRRIWPTTHWAFFDKSQFKRHEDIWEHYKGNVFNSVSIEKQKHNTMQIRNIGGKGFSYDLTKGLHIGRSTTYASMQIGMWMGYTHIYLFGVDMNADGKNGVLHFYGINPDAKPEVRRKRFAGEAEHYNYAADIMPEHDRQRFTFCSSDNPWSFVDRYKKLDHKEAVPLILEHANKL